MKTLRRKSTDRRIDFKSETFSLSNAKTYLGRLVAKAEKGETVFIVRGHKRFVLQEARPIDPIPMRPPGYFANCYNKAEIAEENQLAKASIVRAPTDLE